MKYIRTKVGVYEVEAETDNFYYIDIAREIGVIKSDRVIEADTIEELCDEFVLKTIFVESGNSYYGLYDYHDIRNFQIKDGFTGTWYGAIWTDKGLIYVAKLNEKGELELI